MAVFQLRISPLEHSGRASASSVKSRRRHVPGTNSMQRLVKNPTNRRPRNYFRTARSWNENHATPWENKQEVQNRVSRVLNRFGRFRFGYLLPERKPRFGIDTATVVHFLKVHLWRFLATNSVPHAASEKIPRPAVVKTHQK